MAKKVVLKTFDDFKTLPKPSSMSDVSSVRYQNLAKGFPLRDPKTGDVTITVTEKGTRFKNITTNRGK